MALRRFDPYVAADAMAAHRVTLDHSCWLVRTPDGGLKGCAIGALYCARYQDTPFDQTDVIDWAIESTGSGAYVQGFDAGFHGFTPVADPNADYALGYTDGQVTRQLVDTSDACRPALFARRGSEDTP